MKRNLFLLMAAFVTTTAFAAYDHEYNTDDSVAIYISKGGRYLIYNADFSIQTSYPITVASDIADTVFLVLKDVNIKPENEGSAMLIGANSVVSIILEGEENTLTGKSTGCGIEAQGTVIINGTENTYLTCKGSGRAAAIGTISSSSVAGDIIINGGIIKATSGSESAAIGASNAGKLGNITINGGQVSAIGGAYSSAIGASYISKNTATITITGGTVFAQSGYHCSNRSIGRGNKTHSGTISTVITGGSIIALDEKGNAGGTLDPVATNGEAELSLFKCQLPDVYEATLITSGNVGSIVLGTNYGIKDVYTDENGFVYFYLPEQIAGVEANLNGKAANMGSGLLNTFGDMTNIEITNIADGIIVNNANGKNITICNTIGKTIFNKVVSDNEVISISQKGMFIMTVENEGSFKFIVK